MPYYFVFLFLLVSLQASSQHQIVYLSNQSGNFDLFLTDETGAEPQQLTSNPGWDWSPQWNPELESVFYNSSNLEDEFSLRLYDFVTKQDTSFEHFDLQSFSLAPNAKSALYTLSDANNTYIGIYDLTKQSNRLLVNEAAYNGRPLWSPRGNAFCFISDRDGNSELYLYDFASQEQIRLTHSEKREKYASWLPDGKAIFYTYHYSDDRDREHNDIFRVEIATGVITQVTDDPLFYQEIAVSPDGEKIAFHAKRNGQDQIYTIDIKGKGEKQITRAEAYHGEPIWIPAR